MTQSIKEWLDENVTDDLVESWLDKEASEMENDLVVTAHICQMLIQNRSEFQAEEMKISKQYLEMIADEYYEERYIE